MAEEGCVAITPISPPKRFAGEPWLTSTYSTFGTSWRNLHHLRDNVPRGIAFGFAGPGESHQLRLHYAGDGSTTHACFSAESGGFMRRGMQGRFGALCTGGKNAEGYKPETGPSQNMTTASFCSFKQRGKRESVSRIGPGDSSDRFSRGRRRCYPARTPHVCRQRRCE